MGAQRLEGQLDAVDQRRGEADGRPLMVVEHLRNVLARGAVLIGPALEAGTKRPHHTQPARRTHGPNAGVRVQDVGASLRHELRNGLVPTANPRVYRINRRLRRNALVVEVADSAGGVPEFLWLGLLQRISTGSRHERANLINQVTIHLAIFANELRPPRRVLDGPARSGKLQHGRGHLRDLSLSKPPKRRQCCREAGLLGPARHPLPNSCPGWPCHTPCCTDSLARTMQARAEQAPRRGILDRMLQWLVVHVRDGADPGTPRRVGQPRLRHPRESGNRPHALDGPRGGDHERCQHGRVIRFLFHQCAWVLAGSEIS